MFYFRSDVAIADKQWIWLSEGYSRTTNLQSVIDRQGLLACTCRQSLHPSQLGISLSGRVHPVSERGVHLIYNAPGA